MISDMDVDHPEDDQRWDRERRGETETERLDRNWNSLLQELRVVQTGVQLLTGFLLTLPFQQRFDVLDPPMRITYLATVGCSVAATVLLIAPVGIHRLLFRRHRLRVLVSAAHRCAYAGLALLGSALTGGDGHRLRHGGGDRRGVDRRGVRAGDVRVLLVVAAAGVAHPRRHAIMISRRTPGPRLGWRSAP